MQVSPRSQVIVIAILLIDFAIYPSDGGAFPPLRSGSPRSPAFQHLPAPSISSREVQIRFIPIVSGRKLRHHHRRPSSVWWPKISVRPLRRIQYKFYVARNRPHIPSPALGNLRPTIPKDSDTNLNYQGGLKSSAVEVSQGSSPVVRRTDPKRCVSSSHLRVAPSTTPTGDILL